MVATKPAPAWQEPASSLEARIGADSGRIYAEEGPEETEPSEPGDGGSSDEDGVKPELFPVVQPDISVAEQAESHAAGINRERAGLRLKRHLRRELRRRGCRRLHLPWSRTARCSGESPSREPRPARKSRSSWESRTSRISRSAGPSRSYWSPWKPTARTSRKPASRARYRKKSHNCIRSFLLG